MASSSGSGSGGKPSSKGKAPGGVRTLSDLNSRQDSGSDSDSPQEYYTGGEKSGMLVQDPQKNDNNVDSIFERARRMGAQVGPLEQPQAPPSNARNVFSGTARTLGGDTIERRTEESSTASATPTPHHLEVRNITFWTNGFTVDDGPLRRIDDPANAQFLQSISRSECPKELEPEDRNTPVHVNLIRRPEEWKPRPEPKNVAFKGTSRTLGGTSSQAVDGPSNSNILSNTRPIQGLVIEESIPVTSVQLRLADGTRMVARFNHHHTVGQIHDFINAARPDGSRNYQLQVMGFPPRILNNLDETIEQAGIINAVVIQKA